MPDGERIGLEAFLATEAYLQGVQTYLDGIARMNTATGSAAATMTGEFGQSTGFLNNVLGQLNRQAGITSIGMKGLLSVFSLGTIIGNLLTKGILALVNGVRTLATETVMTAARQRELDFILQTLALRFGFTAEEALKAKQEIIDYGIRADVASDVVAEFIREQLDLAKSTELARAAQDTARIANADSSDTLARFTEGIVRHNIEILRTGRITFDTQQAYERYAESIGKTAKELNNTERSAAFLDATLQEAAKNAGLYEAAMEAPSKQLGSLQRDMFELTRVAGEPFLLAFSNVVNMMRNLAKSLRTAIDEGGPLHSLFINLGAAAGIFTEALGHAVDFGLTTLTNFLNSIPGIFGQVEGDFDGLADSAFEWGANIVISLAEGVVAAASAVIDALVYIGNIITSWLAPGSPPRLLPRLDKWGASALTEYMQGWTQGDFSVFGEIAGTISNFLRSLPKKIVGEKELIPSIIGSRQAVADAINMVNKLGRVTRDAVQLITGSVKESSREMENYIALMLQLELENARVAQAEKDLADVTMFYDEVLAALNAQLRINQGLVNERQRLAEIEAAIATGRLTDEEKARLEAEKRDLVLRRQIREVEFARDVEVAAARDALDAAQERRDAVAGQLVINKQLVDIQIEQNQLITQQIELIKRLRKEQEARAKGRGGKGGPGGFEEPEVPGLGEVPDFGSLNQAVQDRIDDLKGIIGPKLQELADAFDPLQGKVETIGITWSPIFETVGTAISNAYNTYIQPALSGMWTWLETNIPPALEGFTTYIEDNTVPALMGFWNWLNEVGIIPALKDFFGLILTHIPEVLAFAGGVTLAAEAMLLLLPVVSGAVPLFGFLAPLIGTVAGAVLALANPLSLVAIGVGLLAAAWVGNWFNIQEKTANAVDAVRGFISKAWSRITEIFNSTVDDIKNVYKPFLLILQGDFKAAGAAARDNVDEMWRRIKEFFQGGADKAEEIVGNMREGINQFFSDMLDDIVRITNDIVDKITDTDWLQVGRDIVDGIARGISGAVSLATTAISAIASAIREFIVGFFRMKSPSKMMEDLGKFIPMGLGRGIANQAVLNRVSGMVGSAVDSIMSSAIPRLAEGFNRAMTGGSMGSIPQGSMPGGNVTHSSQQISIEVNPTYRNVQSEASIYHDVSAALAVVRR